MSSGTASSLYMTDKIAVGVIVVSGPTKALSFSFQETVNVFGQVLIGADYLASIEPRAQASFSYDQRPVSIDIPDGDGSDDRVWTSAALAALGYASGDAYVAALQAKFQAKWAYIAYFTKYQTFHFAYAGGNRLVMQYKNDHWGPSQINRVFAHETGHIFGAADEYASSECTCARSGNLPVPGHPKTTGVQNFNCEICTTQDLSKTICLMNDNTFKMCTWSRGQLGWGHFEVSNQRIAGFADWANTPGAQAVTGDFNGNGRTDIALVRIGIKGWETQPIAFSNGDGSFSVTNRPIASFADWAATPGAQVITGDFNGNGKTDIAIVCTGDAGWSTQPIAFSNGDGSFDVTNKSIEDFASWAATPGVQVITGDFNGNGKTDIALVRLGTENWKTQPIAFSNGDGSFDVTNTPIAGFASWAGTPGARVITGDFNGNGKTDIALVRTGGTGWKTQPVAFSNGDGSFNVTNIQIAGFADWASTPGVQVVTGDFNGDGKTDIALVGGKDWVSIPVAFSNGDGSFNVTNVLAKDFAGWAAVAGVTVLTGDFNGNGLTDIALVGGKDWQTIPIAFSNGDGSFAISNIDVGEFAAWTKIGSPLLGKFIDHSHATIALVGGSNWKTQPLAAYRLGIYDMPKVSA